MSECCCDDIIIEVNEEGIDGVGIASIELVSTVGITKNYRINLTNGTHFDYSISDGSSIASISKTSSVGLVDTYTVLLTSGDTTTFEVTNGNGIAGITKTSTDNLTDTYTISYTNGTTSTFSVVNGNSIASVSKVSTQVLTDTYQITYTDEDKSPDTFTVVNGRGITSIAKTSTSGLVDTYTITYNDSSTSTFTVTNGEKGDKGDTGDTGNGIASITILSESGLVKTYRITMTDGTHFDFDVTDGEKGDTGETGATGNGITSIEKTATVGLVDTYTITMTDGTTTTFTVTNGSDMWGNITGTLSDQTDLQTALDSKAPAITETASGSIASFTDGSASPVTTLSVGIEPVQDLHGYDNPWPAGGGANQWDEQWELGSFDSQGNPSGSSTSIRCKNFIPVVPGNTYRYVNNTGASQAPWLYDENQGFIQRYGSYMSNGTTITIPEGCHYIKFALPATYGATYKNDVSWNYPSTATSYAPYSNICPISGWDEAVVTRTGKNLLDTKNTTWKKFYINSNVFTVLSDSSSVVSYTINNDYSISASNSSTYRGIGFNITAVDYDRVISISDTESGNNGLRLYSSYTTGASSIRTTTASSLPIYAGESGFLCVLFKTSGTHEFTLQLELGSTATTYEPYQGTSVTIDLDGTRYGGTLDVTTGILTVDRGLFTYTGSEQWNMNGGESVGYMQFVITQGSLANSYTAKTNLFQMIELSDRTQKTGMVRYGDNIVRISFTIADSESMGITDLDSWKAFLASNNLQIWHLLKTPLTVQLTPSQLSTLLGENHIFASTGDVDLTYRADTKLFIQEQIAETLDAVKKTKQIITDVTTEMVAPRNLAEGDYVIVGDDLLKTTATVASGSTLTIGINCVKTTVAEALIALATASE